MISRMISGDMVSKDMAEHLHAEAPLRQEVETAGSQIRFSRQAGHHPAERLARDGVDGAAQDVDVDLQFARELRQYGVVCQWPAERDADDCLAAGYWRR